MGFQLPVGAFVTATATDAGGNTSEFSACRQIVAGTSNTAVPPLPVGGFGILKVEPSLSVGPFDVMVVSHPGVEASLTLLDVAGRRVATRSVKGTTGVQTIHFEEALAPGVYGLKFTSGSSSAEKKVVIVH
jgi:hypothetical protein